MSVLIKGVEMPTACYECRMYQADIYYCSAAERDIDIPSSDEGRSSFCPLVPVPPHGDLIDRDALIVELMDRGVEGLQTDDWHEIQQAVADAPTIIPAEEGE